MWAFCVAHVTLKGNALVTYGTHTVPEAIDTDGRQIFGRLCVHLRVCHLHFAEYLLAFAVLFFSIRGRLLLIEAGSALCAELSSVHCFRTAMAAGNPSIVFLRRTVRAVCTVGDIVQYIDYLAKSVQYK